MNDGSAAVIEDGGINMDAEELSADMAVALDSASAFGIDSGATTPPIVDLTKAPVSVRLKAAREALGLSASDVAKRTRITLRHVEALEAGDYSSLPGRPYALGFARSYARSVGLDGTAIADSVRAELEDGSPRPESRVLHQFEVGDPAKTPSQLVSWLALILVATVLAIGVVFWRSYYAPAVALPALASAEEPRPQDLTRAQSKVPSVAPAQVATGPVVFTALEEGVWVKFYDGQGTQLMQKQLAKGESYTVPADAAAPKLWTGRPDALAITIGGQAIPRLAESEQRLKDVPVDAASLRARSQSPGAGATGSQTVASPSHPATP